MAKEDDWAASQATIVGQEIRRLRGSRSGQWVSDRTAELGYRVARTTISELENGKRRQLMVSELLVIALALETAPAALLYPAPYNEPVQYAPGVEISKFDAVQRFSGIFDPERDRVSGDYWLNTSRLRAEREIRDKLHSAENMLAIATRIGDRELEERMARTLADLMRSDVGLYFPADGEAAADDSPGERRGG
ncbi:hypothetical protein CIW49_18575 [Mycolicibacterium sp. P1-18]|uniref:hypothetical protein n=1 Tax=Mycolicibacterium sp. P1-18 TaxID=2024615 RepID=UPI0011F31186|nr:hypothetical protein [Mycolicibacterium sp. P1-18]KAA0096678.1 hypothetical protein CIW49_18575 [Mycolicibacterium sp. P1-18]